MSDQPGHLIDSLTGRQRVLDRLDRMEARLERIERRLEEAIAYFAVRANRTLDSQATYLGDHTAVTFLENGIRILVDTRSIDIGIHLLTLGRWETPYTTLFTRLLAPGQTVLDLGANHGVYALLAAQAVGPSGRVHAFEPNPRLAHLVDLSLRLNGFGGWAEVHAVGASDSAGTARLVFLDAFSGGGAVAAGEDAAAQPGVDCRLVVLDEVFADPAFRPDVVKMDVEGHEGRVLRGMRRMLERSPGVRLMMEYAPAMMARSGVPAAEVIGLLSGLGLRAWMIDDEGGLAAVGWEALAAMPGGIRNILVAQEAPG
jgi:FkbM family methyltransferase